MSRRHHGRSRHTPVRLEDARTQAQTETRGAPIPERPAAPRPPEPDQPARPIERPPSSFQPAPPRDGRDAPNGTAPPINAQAAPAAIHVNGDSNGLDRAGCTAPQLRRFIKSRPYVPMHELRRRFGINGAEDDVTPLALEIGSIYVGLPDRECRLLGELVRGGEVGYELSLDPRTPIVVGVYPMRPVPRA